MIVRLASAFLLSGITALAAAQAPTPAPETAPNRSEPLTSPGNAKWAATPDEAKARATSENKLVFVEFEAIDCGQCRRMDALLYPAFDFEALLLPMVPVKVGISSPEGRELARRYGVKDTPAIVVTSPEGRLVFRMEGFTNAPEFYQHIHQDLNAYRAFVQRIEGQDIARLPGKEALATGEELFKRTDSEAAAPRLRRAVADPKSTSAVRDEAREFLAAVELELGQIANSRHTVEKLIATTKDSNRRERAELFRAQLPLAENKPAEALALFKKFRRDHPTSIYSKKVDEMLVMLGDTSNPKPNP